MYYSVRKAEVDDTVHLKFESTRRLFFLPKGAKGLATKIKYESTKVKYESMESISSDVLEQKTATYTSVQVLSSNQFPPARTGTENTGYTAYEDTLWRHC